MNREKKISFTLDEQLWKKIKILQINSNLKSLNDVYVILSLQLVNNQVKISESYDITTELQKFLDQDVVATRNVATRNVATRNVATRNVEAQNVET